MSREFGLPRLDGQVAIVTGGGTGIGKATAQLFARQGASVVIANRKASTGEIVSEKISKEGGEATFIATDVSNVSQVQHLINRSVQLYGQIDILFNNAGIELAGSFWEFSYEKWSEMIAVNLTGQFLCAKYVVPHMLVRGSGAIVNMSSVLGYASLPGLTAYTTTKAAIIGMTKAMALDLAGNGIRVNCIVPGTIDTEAAWQIYDPAERPKIKQLAAESIPMGRIASPKEIASAVLFLVSPAASFITGTSLIADGGMLAMFSSNH